MWWSVIQSETESESQIESERRESLKSLMTVLRLQRMKNHLEHLLKGQVPGACLRAWASAQNLPGSPGVTDFYTHVGLHFEEQRLQTAFARRGPASNSSGIGKSGRNAMLRPAPAERNQHPGAGPSSLPSHACLGFEG